MTITIWSPTACDAFPLNACAGADGDGDGHPDMVADEGDTLTTGGAVCTTAMRAVLIDMMVGSVALQADNCPTNANANQVNSDSDDDGNVCDVDDDNDLVADGSDAFPLNACAGADGDGDGHPDMVANEGDTLITGGAVCTTAMRAVLIDMMVGSTALQADNCPTNANADQVNSDGDTEGNVCDADDDNDLVADGSDAFPLNACASIDNDGDNFPDTVATPMVGQACDDDEAAALVAILNGEALAAVKIAGCAVGAFAMCADGDDDDDTVADGSDAFPLNACASADTDGDMYPDAILDPSDTSNQCDTDDALALIVPIAMSGCSIGALDMCSDAFANDPCAAIDSDMDGVADIVIAADDSNDDACTTDSIMIADNCPMVANPGQEEDMTMMGTVALTDSDTVGDACDVDDDNDGLIEIGHLEDLNNIRYNLAGTSYKTSGGDSGSTSGAPSSATTDCNTAVDGVFLCGYELIRKLNFDGATSYREAATNMAAWAANNADRSLATNAGWQPLAHDTSSSSSGFQGTQLSTVVEGNGFVIANLYMRRSSEEYVGLIGAMSGAGVVRNLGLTDLFIVGKSFVGGFIGRNISGTLSASWGGGNITSGDRIAGGLIGLNYRGVVSVSWSTSSMMGNDFVGGLIGHNNEGIISISWNSGSVTSSDDNTGGLAGYNSGTISTSWNSGSVIGGDDFAGGLVGWNDTGGTISTSWNSGSVMGNDDIGGLAGTRNGIIATSYWDVEASTRVFGLGSDDDTSGNSPTDHNNIVDGSEVNQLMAQGLTTAQMSANSGTYPNFGAVAAIVGSTGLTGNFSAAWDYTAGCYPRLRRWLDDGVDNVVGTADDSYHASELQPAQGDPTAMDGVCAP